MANPRSRVRVELKGDTKFVRRLLALAHFEQQGPEVPVQPGAVRHDGQPLPAELGRLGKPSFLHEQFRQIHIGGNMVRLEADRLAEAATGQVYLALLAIAEAEVVIGGA